jgi:hypothetical protein
MSRIDRVQLRQMQCGCPSESVLQMNWRFMIEMKWASPIILMFLVASSSWRGRISVGLRSVKGKSSS